MPSMDMGPVQIPEGAGGMMDSLMASNPMAAGMSAVSGALAAGTSSSAAGSFGDNMSFGNYGVGEKYFASQATAKNYNNLIFGVAGVLIAVVIVKGLK